MAALQKIRSSSWIIGLMGVGMFLFILTMVLDQKHLVCAEKFQQQRWFCVWQKPFATGLL